MLVTPGVMMSGDIVVVDSGVDRGIVSAKIILHLV